MDLSLSRQYVSPYPLQGLKEYQEESGLFHIARSLAAIRNPTKVIKKESTTINYACNPP
jgi:hypothetical protein